MLEVRTPSRLHFGLLAYGPEHPRQFGGVGLMVRKPDVMVRLAPAGDVTASGPQAMRAIEFGQRFLKRAAELRLFDRRDLPGAEITVVRVPRPHSGLGTGTQLGLAIAQGMALLAGLPDLDAAALAHLAGRGERSAVGVHGFMHGGLIVEAGKGPGESLSPSVIRMDFPKRWRLVLAMPERLEGLSGDRELAAFAALPAIPKGVTAELCRLTLLGLLPALVEEDVAAFGQALFDMQQIVGLCFANAQGGIYGDPLLADMAAYTRSLGVKGVGQSSWGPTLYAVMPNDREARKVAEALRQRFSLSDAEVFVAEADNHGAKATLLEEAM